MSLVAYDTSSDEDSDNEESTQEGITQNSKQQIHRISTNTSVATNDHISDDEDDYMLGHNAEQTKSSIFTMTLPKPRKETTVQDILENIPRPPFQALPTPKSLGTEIINEDDDEFLHKKDKFVTTETKPPPKVPMKVPVKISIPSLEEFRDVQNDLGEKGKHGKVTMDKKPQAVGLLGLLPIAKSERSFSKSDTIPDRNIEKTASKSVTESCKPAFIPDTVKYRRPAHSTEEFAGTTKKINPSKSKPKLVSCSDSEASDEEDSKAGSSGKDFFSLTSEDCLPEVSASEISAMVAKKAAKMGEITKKYLAQTESKAANEANVERSNHHELEMARKRYQEQQLDAEAVQALVGSSAKRRRNQNDTIEITDLNSAEILPSREEWMRTALASSTVYQPTGVLVDEEPAAGTRRKHQITYLAHKAKANEAELQAMWSANRQTRRAAQSKYGF